MNPLFYLSPLLLPVVAAVNPEDIEQCIALGSPRTKCVIDGLTEVIVHQESWDDWDAWVVIMQNFFTDDMIYDSNWTPNGDFSNNTGIREWYDNEHIPFNLAFDNATFSLIVYTGEEHVSSYIAYAKAKWRGDLGTLPGSLQTGSEVTIWDLDFYELNEEGTKIRYNWCLIDFLDLARQLGYQLLPKPALPEGIFYPPRAMDGIPAPISRLASTDDARLGKEIIRRLLDWDFVEGHKPSPFWAEDMVWYGGTGFGMATSKDQYEEHILQPLRAGISNRHLELNVVSCEGSYCGAHGYIVGNHSGQWLGEQPTNKEIKIRFGIHWRLAVGEESVKECWAMFDLPAAFIGVGINLFDRVPDFKQVKAVP